MSKKIKYTKGEIGKYKIIEDNFLPKPEDIVLKVRPVKVTIDLTQSSVDFFKNLAAISHTPYQKIIRKLLDQYVENHMNHKIPS